MEIVFNPTADFVNRVFACYKGTSFIPGGKQAFLNELSTTTIHGEELLQALKKQAIISMLPEGLLETCLQAETNEDFINSLFS